jgi:hypothetical protein
MSKSKNVVRIWNWNFLGGHLIETGVLIVLGVSFVAAWITGKLADKGEWERFLVPFMGFVLLASGVALLTDAFRKFALWVELGGKVRYRMLTHSRTRKWSDVKSFKLGWEVRKYLRRIRLGYEERRWRMLIIRFCDGTVVKVHVKPKHEEQLQQFTAELTEAGLSLHSSE